MERKGLEICWRDKSADIRKRNLTLESLRRGLLKAKEGGEKARQEAYLGPSCESLSERKEKV